MDNYTLSQRLRKLRVARGLSQADMAQALGLNHSTAIAKIEANDRRVSGIELAAWAKACGTTAEAIVDGGPILVDITAEQAS